MKVKGLIYIGFRDHMNLYSALRTNKKRKINLNFDLKKLIFGPPDFYYDMIKHLSPYNPNIEDELNPVKNDKPHLNGNFVVKHDLHIFPLEFKSDITGKVIDSYEYTFGKRFEPVSQTKIQSNTGIPAIAFNLDFLPTISVYHIKYMPRIRMVIDLLGLCGGILSLVGVANFLLSTGVKLASSQ